MPEHSARIVSLYVMAVVLPLLALAGIFHAGKDLKAPAHAAGGWSVESAPMCGASAFTVSQTARLLTITLGGHRADGTIDGDTVRFQASEASCAVTVVAKLHRGTRPHLLTGELHSSACESCPAAPFRAARRAEGEGRSR